MSKSASLHSPGRAAIFFLTLISSPAGHLARPRSCSISFLYLGLARRKRAAGRTRIGSRGSRSLVEKSLIQEAVPSGTVAQEDRDESPPWAKGLADGEPSSSRTLAGRATSTSSNRSSRPGGAPSSSPWRSSSRSNWSFCKIPLEVIRCLFL